MDLDRDRDRDRPPYHRTPSINSGGTAATGELLVCFASRLSSSSSMKLSKSILSPGRSRDPSLSLSTSLSRRLRSNGSIKAGQASPMFPKKRGSAFENPEPSSPKVTCIGQVRVKTKKKVKHTRSLSNRRGDLSFRKLDQGTGEAGSQSLPSLQGQRSSSAHYQECVPHRNQRWVHLPLTICEALRTFGAEFSCLFPCRSSCFSPNEREKVGKENGSKDCSGGEPPNGQQHRSCGAVLARWLVAVQEDGEGEKDREIELVVTGEEEERIGGRPSNAMPSSRSRRHVFEDFDLKSETFQEHKVEEEETVVAEDEKGRVSICIPPKNALLLMRCRSDPMKMAALTNRFWETPSNFTKNEGPKGDQDIAVEEQEESEPEVEVLVVNDECAVELTDEYNASSVLPAEEDLNEETLMDVEAPSCEKEESQLHPEEVAEGKMEETNRKDVDSALLDSRIDHHHQSSIENVSSQTNDYQPITENAVGTDGLLSSEQDEKEEERIPPRASSSSQINYNSPEQHCEADDDNKQEASLQEEVTDEAIVEEPDAEIENETLKKVVEEQEENVTKLSRKEDALPDCLLLMMCEPKLSMEVSKETWVCSTDFVRWVPERQPQLKARKKDTTVNERPQCPSSAMQQQQQDRSRQLLLQPVRRSSCSLPPRSSVSGGSMASMIEKKLVNAMAYEPFVLTRCKSEPMRTAAAKLAPEPCFWKDRKLLEPHRRATFGFGAAGVGF